MQAYFGPRTSNHSLYLIKLTLSRVPAILGETSEGTSYQMVRLVFRPYTHVKRSICTSEPCRASTRISPGFALRGHSSPSFGSRHSCSDSTRCGRLQGRRSVTTFTLLTIKSQVSSSCLCLHSAHGLSHPSTRTIVRLLGPCFKTGP